MKIGDLISSLEKYDKNLKVVVKDYEADRLFEIDTVIETNDEFVTPAGNTEKKSRIIVLDY